MNSFTQQSTDQQGTFFDLQQATNIKSVHFSPYEWSQDVIVAVLQDLIIIGHVSIQDEITIKKLTEIKYEGTYTTLAISPETCINTLPIHIQFCTADIKDFNLLVYSCTDSSDEDGQVYKELVGHRNYVNAIAYDSENNHVSSVSDDRTCRVWSVADDYKCVAIFALSSPGMGTCWHREDPSKLLIAEKCGVLRFYNINTQKAIMSFDVRRTLHAAHWSPHDAQLIGALQLGELVLWDATKPSAARTKLLYTQPGGALRFSALGELVASVNKLAGSLKVTHVASLAERLDVRVQLPTNVTWHCRLPVVCLGDDRKLCFWRLKSK